MDQLISAFRDPKSEKDIKGLFESIFTKTEKLMLAKRLAIAVLLEQGLSYPEISSAIKVSSVTISFVRNNIMKNNDGYLQLIRALDKRIVLELKKAKSAHPKGRTSDYSHSSTVRIFF